MKIISAKPEWDRTLQPGYCGFITRERDFVGDGIEYFEHFETGLPFVHTFVIEGPAPASGTQDLSPKDNTRVTPLNQFSHSAFQASDDNSPSPGGEGRGEGGLSPAEARGSNIPSLQGKGASASTRNLQPSTCNIIEAHAATGVARANNYTLSPIGGDLSRLGSGERNMGEAIGRLATERAGASESAQGEGAPAPTCNIIEAHAGTGVARATLQQYLGQKNVQCFIRIPIGYTEKIGADIVSAASAHLGEKYGFGLIIADALANTFLGHCINRLTLNTPDKFLCWLLDNQHAKICSQLVALALQSQFYLRLRGCLRRPADTILPKELGNDPQIWDPVIYKIQN